MHRSRRDEKRWQRINFEYFLVTFVTIVLYFSPVMNVFLIRNYQTELEEHINALKSSEDHSKKAAADASRLAEELRQEQEHSAQIEKARRTAEALAKDLQTRLDEAEAAAMQGGRKIVQKMEQVYIYALRFIYFV